MLSSQATLVHIFASRSCEAVQAQALLALIPEVATHNLTGRDQVVMGKEKVGAPG